MSAEEKFIGNEKVGDYAGYSSEEEKEMHKRTHKERPQLREADRFYQVTPTSAVWSLRTFLSQVHFVRPMPILWWNEGRATRQQRSEVHIGLNVWYIAGYMEAFTGALRHATDKKPSGDDPTPAKRCSVWDGSTQRSRSVSSQLAIVFHIDGRRGNEQWSLSKLADLRS
ncbi:predicted protein [Postia placenta Mad-698-R]|nr:predicted protein [Postia placenta Mad-698-R]